MAMNHQPNGGKLTHSARPATIVTPNCGQPVDHRLTEAPCPSGNFGRFVGRGRLGVVLFVTGFVVGFVVLGAGRRDVRVVGGGGPIAPTAGAAHARSTKEPSHG